MWEHAGLAAAALGLILNLIGSAVFVTRAIGRLEISLLGAITIERKEIDATIEQLERRYGETNAALRERIVLAEREAAAKVADLLATINSFEKWSRDTFVRREGFYKVRDDLQADIKELGAQIYQRLERMEKKIDGKGADAE